MEAFFKSKFFIVSFFVFLIILSFSRNAFSSTDTVAPITTANPLGGTYSSSVSVTLTANESATIYYTIDGSMPTTASAVYNSAITISTTTGLRYFAVDSSGNTETVKLQDYTITAASQVATPTASVAAGTYSSAQSVTLSTTTTGASIYYTTNGTTPSASSTLYTGAISISSTTTLKAIAIKSGMTNSAVMSNTYTITAASQVATPTASVAAGTYSSAQSVTLSTATTGASIYYTTNNTAPTTSSTLYSGAISISSTTTLRAIAVKSGMTNSAELNNVYTISAPAGVNTGIYESAVKSFESSPIYGNISWMQGFAGSYNSNAFTVSTGSSGFNYPNQIVIDSLGNTYIADSSNNRVLKCAAGGLNCTASFTVSIGSSTYSSKSVAVDSLNNVYIADSQNSRILKCPTGGTVCNEVFSVTTGPSTFWNPSSMDIDNVGNLYLADRQNNRVLKCSIDTMTCGQTLSAAPGITAISDPVSVAVDSVGNVYVGMYSSGRVIKCAAGGLTCGTDYGVVGTQLRSLDADSLGNIYVIASGVIKKCSTGGTSCVNSAITSPSLGWGIAVDKADNFYVSGNTTSGVFKLSSDTSVKMLVRTGNSENTSDASWAAWSDNCEVKNNSDINTNANNVNNPCVDNGERYVQYRAILSTITGTNVPTLSSVTIETEKTYKTNFVDSYLISSPFDTNKDTNTPYNRLTSISWNAQRADNAAINPGQVGFQFRSSDGSRDIYNNLIWQQWCGPVSCGELGAGGDGNFYKDTPSGQTINTETYIGKAFPGQPDKNKYFQYAAFLKAINPNDSASSIPVVKSVSIGFSFNTPPIINVTNYVQNSSNGKAEISYTVKETKGTNEAQVEQIKVFPRLFYGLNGVTINNVGILANDDTNTVGTFTINNPNNLPIPSSGQMLIDNELISFTASGSTITVPTGGRHIGFNGSDYLTLGDKHLTGTQVFFMATAVTGSGTGDTTPPSELAVPLDGSVSSVKNIYWDVKAESNVSFNGKYLNNVTFKVAANDKDAFYPVGVATVNNKIVDLKGPTFNTPTGADGVSATPVKDDVIKILASDDSSIANVYYGFSNDNVCDANDNITTSFTNNVSFTVSGNHTDWLCAKAVDSFGNVGFTTIGQLNTDNTAPEAVTNTSIATDGIINFAERNAIKVTGTAEANSLITVKLQNGANSKTGTQQLSSGATNFEVTVDGTTATPAKLEDGNITAEMTATDAAGNISTAATLSATQDTEIPNAPVVSSIADDNKINDSEKGAIKVIGTAEADSFVTVKLTDSQAHELTATQQLSGGATAYEITIDNSNKTLVDGNINASVTAKDAAGNISTAATSTATQDTAIPNAPVVSSIADDNKINDGEKGAIKVVGTAEADSFVTVKLTDSQAHELTATQQLSEGATAYEITIDNSNKTLVDGNINSSVTAKDAAGNTSTAATSTATQDTINAELDYFDVDKETVDAEHAYGIDVPMEVRAYYKEDLQEGSTIDIRLDLAATDKPENQKSDGDRNVTNLVLRRDETNVRMLKGTFTTEGPRKGYDTNALNIRYINSENVIDVAGNVQIQSGLTEQNDINARKTIKIDTGTPVLWNFSATQGNFKAGQEVTIYAQYSKDIKNASVFVRLNSTDQAVELKSVNQSAKSIVSGTYFVGGNDNSGNHQNLRVEAIISQTVTDFRDQPLSVPSVDSEPMSLVEYNQYAVQNEMDTVSDIDDGTRIDTKAPNSASISINDGASETKTNEADLKFSVVDNFDVNEIKIQVSNSANSEEKIWCDLDGNKDGQSNYVSEYSNWNFMNGNCGNQPEPDAVTDNIDAKVFVKYIDAAKNEVIAEDQILYNGVPPRITKMEATVENGKVYGPGMEIPIILTYNKPLSETQTSTASVYFNTTGFANEFVKTDAITLSGKYIVKTGENTNKLDAVELRQNVFSTTGSEQTSNQWPTSAQNEIVTKNIIIDSTAPTGYMNIDRSVGGGNMVITFTAADLNAKDLLDSTKLKMKAKIKVASDKDALCGSFDAQPEIEVTQENNSVTINRDDAAYIYTDDNEPKKVCVQLIDQAGNKTSDDQIFAVTPETPQNLNVTDSSNVSAGFFGTFVTWKIPAAATSTSIGGFGTNGFSRYELLRCSVDKNAANCTPNDFTTNYADKIDDPARNYKAFNNLDPNKKYCYRVRLRDRNGDDERADYSNFSSTACVVPGENVQVSKSVIDVRNGSGDISIHSITKEGANVKFVTQDLQQGAVAFQTIAGIEVYASYKKVDDQGNAIAEENRLQDKITTIFSDSAKITSLEKPIGVTEMNPTPEHDIRIYGLEANKKYYFKITAFDAQDFDHVKTLAYNETVNSNLTFSTLGKLTAITEISDPPAVLSTKDAVINFRTDQPANCYVEFGTKSAAQATSTTDNSGATNTADNSSVQISSTTSTPSVYTEVPVKEVEGEYITTHSIHLAGLLPQTIYYYKITCSDGTVENPSIVSSNEGKFRTLDRSMTEEDFAGRIDGNAPTIGNISLANVTGENATVTWTTNEPASSLLAYELEGTDFMLMAGDYTVNTDSKKYSTVHTVQLKGLLPASKYSFTAISADASGNIGQSNLSAFTTKEPSSLSSVKVLSKALGQATITWETGNPTSSTVEYGLTTAYGSKKEDSSMTKEHTVTLTDLKPGETYHFRVKGEDDQKNIYASSDMTFQPKAPPKISDFKIDSITEHEAVVTFNTNVSTNAIISYENTEKSEDSGFQGRPDFVSKHEIKLKDLTSGATFSIKLKVRDEDGNETEETFPNFTTAKDEAAPKIDRVKTDAALTQNDKVQAIISWSTDELATGEIIYKEGKNGEEKKYEVNSAPAFSHIGVITSFKSGVVYYFKVKSTDAAGNTITSTDYALLTPKQRQNIIQVIIGNFTDIFGWAKF